MVVDCNPVKFCSVDEPSVKRPDVKLSIPFALIDKTEVDVAKPESGVAVAIYSNPPALRNVQWLLVSTDGSDRASCGAVDEATWSAQ